MMMIIPVSSNIDETPSFENTLKTVDIIKTSSAEEHCRIVKIWAEQILTAWNENHSYIYSFQTLFLKNKEIEKFSIYHFNV